MIVYVVMEETGADDEVVARVDSVFASHIKAKNYIKKNPGYWIVERELVDA